jgi:hypothetical protein
LGDKGGVPNLLDLSYAIPPYKIPDSLSVPTHVLMACGYKNDQGRLDVPLQKAGSWAGAGYPDPGIELPPTLPHLFNVSGSTTTAKHRRQNCSRRKSGYRIIRSHQWKASSARCWVEARARRWATHNNNILPSHSSAIRGGRAYEVTVEELMERNLGNA